MLGSTRMCRKHLLQFRNWFIFPRIIYVYMYLNVYIFNGFRWGEKKEDTYQWCALISMSQYLIIFNLWDLIANSCPLVPLYLRLGRNYPTWMDNSFSKKLSLSSLTCQLLSSSEIKLFHELSFNSSEYKRGSDWISRWLLPVVTMTFLQRLLWIAKPFGHTLAMTLQSIFHLRICVTSFISFPPFSTASHWHKLQGPPQQALVIFFLPICIEWRIGSPRPNNKI